MLQAQAHLPIAQPMAHPAAVLPAPPSKSSSVSFQVPAGVQPGQQLAIPHQGTTVMVTVGANWTVGQMITVAVPATPQPMAVVDFVSSSSGGSKSCSACGGVLQPSWVACPACGVTV